MASSTGTGSPSGQPEPRATVGLPVRANSSKSSLPPPGQTLTGKQEHYLKRELISVQVGWEISELNSPTALRRFGAPFKSDLGEVTPYDSELPILRYIFVHHVRGFPFLDKAREKEFWQDKLQVFLESFASKNISSSEDRLEETKRRKLARKSQKLVELMMVSGIPTSSGFEERIRFSELEVVDRDAIDTGLLHTQPEGNYINGWDVNMAGVRVIKVRGSIRSHRHAEFILRVKKKGENEYFIGRRYGDFSQLQKQLRLELPGKVFQPLPKKNKSSSSTGGLFGGRKDDSDDGSISSASTQRTAAANGASGDPTKLSVKSAFNHRKSASSASSKHGRSASVASSIRASPRPSMDNGPFVDSPRHDDVILYREEQRVSLRAFLRSLLQNPQVAQTKFMEDFLTRDPIKLSDEDCADILQRKTVDERRIEEQVKFYEIARKRAAELDIYMEQFRQEIVNANGLTRLFQEIKDKETIQDLSIQYQKFAEWLRIEVAATIYHLFLAEDNSPELFAQAKRIHSLIPYTIIKNIIRVANPAAVMSSILDVFLAQPFGTKSLMQRIFSLALNDGIRTVQKSIDAVGSKIDDPVFVSKLSDYAAAEEHIKRAIREEALAENVDLVVAVLRSDAIKPSLTGQQIQRLYNAYVAFNSAIENVDDELKQGAQLFAYLKTLMKLETRQRDKQMMLSLIQEKVTLQLLRDLFTIFYEPLVRVYKSANVYGSVTDFAVFMDDMIQVVEKCREQDASADPNQTVQAFIDLCQRHEHNFYNFVHEVHTHDNGLFTQLMEWIEDILEFLRKGPKNGALDINALFEGAAGGKVIDKDVAIKEVNELISWQEARKKWHQDKTRQKMAADGGGGGGGSGGSGGSGGGGADSLVPGGISFHSADFGLDQMDLEDMNYESGSDSQDEASEDDELDPIEAERRRRAKRQDRLRRSAGEPVKPHVEEVHKLKEIFLVMLRQVLAE